MRMSDTTASRDADLRSGSGQRLGQFDHVAPWVADNGQPPADVVDLEWLSDDVDTPPPQLDERGVDIGYMHTNVLMAAVLKTDREVVEDRPRMRNRTGKQFDVEVVVVGGQPR